MPMGIALRAIAQNSIGGECATLLQTLLGRYYPSPAAKVLYDQQADYLSACGDQCVQIEINY
jgi:hypothetical protein